MKSVVLIGLVLAQVLFANAGLMSNHELRQNFQFTDVTPGQRIRHYEAQVWPDVASARALALLGVQAEVTGETSGEVDAVAFALSNVLQTAIAFGYYHAEASVSGLGSGNVTGNIGGSAFALLWRAFHVFEFVDNNGVTGYQPDADNITGAYDLSSIFLPWDPIQIDVQNLTTPDGQETRLFIVSMQTSDEVFFMRFTCVGYPAQVGTVKITPDSIKIDLRIRYFGNPYFTTGSLYATGPSSEPNAQVGLSSALGAWAASVNIENGATDTTPNLQLTTDNFAGFFNWEGQAGVVVGGVEVGRAVTGVVVPIEDPSIEAVFAGGWVAQVMVFSFQGIRPTEVNWDPEMGANIDYAGLSAGVALQPTIMVALMSFLFVFFKNF